MYCFVNWFHFNFIYSLSPEKIFKIVFVLSDLTLHSEKSWKINKFYLLSTYFWVWLLGLVTRANYRLKWKKIFTCTTFSPFTFAYNHENSNFPPFLTNLRKKDSFLLPLRFEPGPPGWQSTMLASRPGSQDM